MSISWDDAAKNESSRLQIILVADTWDYMSRPESESWRSCVEGGGRTIKASMSQLYYVPACVSSLMQSLCPPNVTHTRIYARARGERFFVLHKRNFFSLFFFYCRRISAGTERFVFLEAYLFIFFVLLFFPRISSAQVCLVHRGLPSVNARDRSIISR